MMPQLSKSKANGSPFKEKCTPLCHQTTLTRLSETTLRYLFTHAKEKYLKFKTQQEMDQWSFEKDRTFVVHGCLHFVDGKELVFNITQVEPSSK